MTSCTCQRRAKRKRKSLHVFHKKRWMTFFRFSLQHRSAGRPSSSIHTSQIANFCTILREKTGSGVASWRRSLLIEEMIRVFFTGGVVGENPSKFWSSSFLQRRKCLEKAGHNPGRIANCFVLRMRWSRMRPRNQLQTHVQGGLSNNRAHNFTKTINLFTQKN